MNKINPPRREAAASAVPLFLTRLLLTRRAASARQRGSAMIEFAVVGPIISLLGLAVLQYCLII
jgi:Flp pilus assembly protein TadG